MKFPAKRKISKKRMTVMVLATILAVTVLMSVNYLTASAYRSLSHIETIKQTKSVFTIVELVPREGAGSIGYYAPGQEPTANWLSQLAKIAPSGSVTGPDARKAWADALFQQLTASGLLSSNSTTPLTSVAAYSEQFPWANDGNPSGTILYLTDAAGAMREEKESTMVRGNFLYQGVDSANFDQISAPVLVAEGNYGTHVQNILRFSYATQSEAGFYYYNPQFELVDIGRIDSYVGKALYLSIPADDISNPTYGSTAPVEIKRYAGTLGQDGFGVDIHQTYFCVTSSGRPSAAGFSATTPYRAEADGFAEESNGYFNMIVEGYSFMGSGKGNYSFVPNASASPVKVQYDHVYVSGGYHNNNWFLTHVFDEAGSKLAVRVYSVTPSSMEAGALGNMLERADLIVLSAGFDLTNNGGSLAGLYTSAGNDLTTSQSQIIQQAVAAGRPLLLDGRLKSGSARVNTLAVGLMGSKNTAFVENSLYCFVPDSTGTTREALATADFALPFTTGYAAEGDPYYPVMAEINYENFLRSQAGDVDPLPNSVTMANCIRYIINSIGQRVQNVKTSINILELQPNANASQLKKVRNPSATDYNSPYNVFRWLPENTFSSVSDVKITTMSTSEFIGRIEDINEEYDLVYVGDSTSGFHLSGGCPDYNDSRLDGLLYANIGDIYNSNLRLVGLLDRDYSSNGNINTSASRSFRFSGNDITAAKQRQLENFADSGFPVIFANNLVNAGSAATQASEFTAQVTASSSNGTVTLSAAPRLSNALTGVSYSYQWYNGRPSDSSRYAISGADGVTYVPATPGNYCCEIVLRQDTSSYAVFSNYVSLQKDFWSVAENASQAGSSTFYPVSINRNGSSYYISVSGTSPTAYQWYSRSSSTGSWSSIRNATSYSYNFSNSNNYFMCRVTINGQYYYSKQIQRNDNSYTTSAFSGTYTTTTATLALNASYQITSSGVIFTASGQITPTIFASTISYNWYGPGSGYLTSSYRTQTVEEGAYYCLANTSFTDSDARSRTYTVTSGLSAIVQGGGTSIVIPGKAAVASNINASRVDNSALLYSTLNQILPKPNVMPASEAMEQRETVLKYLNLSKPSIVFSNKPTEYSGNLSANLVPGQTLSYSFQILNPTDSTPASTRYRCRLYLDQNADGRYVEEEELTDLTILADGKQVDAAALTASTSSAAITYTVSRTLPSTFSGIIPWKLEIVKVGSEQTYSSETGYTYIKPNMLTLNILQISSYPNGSGTRFSLEAQNLDTNSTYGKLFKQLRDNGVYNIQITTRSVSQINGTGWTLNSGEKAFDINNNGKLETETELYNYLNSFNMLILGFGDGYGYGETGNGLSETVAKAVVRYIAGNKAVLFTHDTTSYVNLPDESRYSSMYSGQWSWGYYFNSVIRSAVGLDRYGVTDPIYGVTKYSPINTKSGSGLIANSYAGFNSTVAETLRGKDYSIAYQPGSGRASTVPETQGYSAINMLRFSNDRSQQTPLSTLSCPSSESGTLVTTVSQVNQGQITTFPYDLNSTEFGGARTSLTVGTTHEQYYQLNMNSEDIVVWYCLSGSRFDAMKNDVINNYYIYNRGNVTYSGAGHMPFEVTQDEAKLFVNTMIAAYRAGAVTPTVNFTASNTTSIDSFFLPAEYTSTEANNYSCSILVNSGQSEERAVYFVLTDPNLASGKTTSVEFYYQNAAGSDLVLGSNTVKATKLAETPIYRVDESKKESLVANAGLRSGVLYKIYLPDEVLNAFGNHADASMPFYIRAVTSIQEMRYIGFDTLTLRKLGLLSLC